MGGTSTQQGTQTQLQNTNQTQTATPWGPAQGTIAGVLGNLQNINPNLSGVQSNAINALIAQGQAGNPFAGGLANTANSLLAGGGAMTNAPLVSGALGNLNANLAGIANPANLNPLNTPGLADALRTATEDITNQIGGQFAAAGRDPTGNAYGPQSIARGVLQGISPTIANAYQANVNNLMGANQALFGGATGAAGQLAAMQQNAIANQLAGATTAAPAALEAQQYGPLLQLTAAAQQTGIPLGILSQIMGIGLPAASAFGTTTGTGTMQGTGGTQQSYTMSPAQQFALLTGGMKNLFGGSGTTGGSTAGGILNFLGQ